MPRVKLTRQVAFKLSDEDYARLEEWAGENHVPMATWVRMVLRKKLADRARRVARK